MKRNFLLLMMLFAGSVCFAQSPSLGIKGGLNITNIKMMDNASDYKAGFHVGGLAHFHLSKEWAIQPELMFSQQGGKSRSEANKTSTNLDYLTVPVLVQYMFNNGFRLQAGPQLGILVNAKSKLGGNSTDIKDRYKTADISFPIGIGYLTHSGLGIDARWVPGLTNIQKSGTNHTNNGFQLGLFYQFPQNGHSHK